MRRKEPAAARRNAIGMIRGALALVLVLGIWPATPARAAPAAVVTMTFFSYLPGDDEPGVPTLVVPRGTDVLAVNLELVLVTEPHTLTSNGCAGETLEPCRFDSGVVQPGQEAPVATAGLPPGTYGFYCQAHPVAMSGSLVVT